MIFVDQTSQGICPKLTVSQPSLCAIERITNEKNHNQKSSAHTTSISPWNLEGDSPGTLLIYKFWRWSHHITSQYFVNKPPLRPAKVYQVDFRSTLHINRYGNVVIGGYNMSVARSINQARIGTAKADNHAKGAIVFDAIPCSQLVKFRGKSFWFQGYFFRNLKKPNLMVSAQTLPYISYSRYWFARPITWSWQSVRPFYRIAKDVYGEAKKYIVTISENKSNLAV